MILRFLVRAVLASAALSLGATEKPKLSAYDRSQGWRLIFDGADASEWRGYRQETFPANWRVQDGSLVAAPGAALVSAAEYADFELQFSWRLDPGGRGAVYFRVSEDGAAPGETGPHLALGESTNEAGGNGYRPPDRRLSLPPGVWHQARILVYGNVIEYWLNQERVMVYTVDTPEWHRMVAARGSANTEFGRLPAGRLALAGRGVAFREIKVRSQ